MPDPFESLRPHLQTVIDSVTVPILFVDRGRRVRVWNRAFAEAMRESSQPLRDRPVTELFAAEFRERVLLRLVPACAETGQVQMTCVRLPGLFEEEMLVTWTEFAHQGETLGWLGRFSPMVTTGMDPALREVLEREQRQRQRFQALLAVTNAVIGSLDLNTILSTIARQVREVIRTDECTVFLYDEAGPFLVPAVCEVENYYEEMMSCRLRLGEGITGWAALHRRGEIVNDAENDPRAVIVPGTPPEQSSIMCVPLLSREKLLGVITMARAGTRGFADEDLELATLFAGQCSAAIENARLYEGLKSAYDELRETQSQLVQSAKLNALGEMAGGVAHDFNNILAVILGRTQLLMQGAADDESRRQLKVIEQAALDGAQTVRRVQEFTRVRHDERFDTLDVNQVLHGVLELTRLAWEAGAKRLGVAFQLDLDLRATATVAGNASELCEVFTNLVLNAVDAMPGDGTLTISSESDDDQVRVRIRDDGVGMDENTRGRIFDPFFTTKTVKGTGLGLSVAYGIVARHHGSIDVESAPGAGTTFTLVFPAGAGAERKSAPAGEGPLPRLSVLVVDDEQPVLQVLADLLGAMGQEVRTALGGAAGLEAFRREPCDAVFTDLGMPDLNGWDLARAVRTLHPDVAVVLVTGWGFQLEEGVAHARGVDLIMPKPFSIEEVERALRQVGAGRERLRPAA